ncbi:HD domain-containing phosphohydrolase [Bradyrhizobium sp. USDA 3256]
MQPDSIIRAFDVAKALAFVGDFSMGQPTDHSLRTAWIARKLAAVDGLSSVDVDVVCEASLLRWTGCIASAVRPGELPSDDIAEKAGLVGSRTAWINAKDPNVSFEEAIRPLALIHCEASEEIGRMLYLGGAAQGTLRRIFEIYDGRRKPLRAAPDRIPRPVFIVSLASDLEIFTRAYGVEGAMTLLSEKGGTDYPANLARVVMAHSPQWLSELDRMSAEELDTSILTGDLQKIVSTELIADVVDLKLPWAAGASRIVAQVAAACCRSMGLNEESQTRVYRAGLIHGIGNVAVAGAMWSDPASRSASAWEKVRLAPYWTLRAGKQIPALAQEAEIASFAHERLDGSGYFRGAVGNSIPLEARILGAAVAWVELRSARPWREGLPATEAMAQLENEVRIGRFEPSIVGCVGSNRPGERRFRPTRSKNLLSSREIEVLHRISLGGSNKEVARDLRLSPSTVRTHVESIFRKLECSTRTAATFKASSMGLLPSEPTGFCPAIDRV